MTDTTTLKADVREKFGTSESKRMRRAGLLPAILYGHGKGTRHISVASGEFDKLLAAGQRMFTIEFEGAEQHVLLKAIQYNPMGDKIVHVDFTRVAAGEKVKLNIAIELVGTPKGTKGEGNLEHILKEVEIECLPTAIPTSFVLNVIELDVEDVLRVKDIEAPEGVTITANPEDIIAQIVVKLEEEEAEEPEFDLPEVIGEAEPGEDQGEEEKKK